MDHRIWSLVALKLDEASERSGLAWRACHTAIRLAGFFYHTTILLSTAVRNRDIASMPGIYSEFPPTRKRKRQGPDAEADITETGKIRKIEKKASRNAIVEQEILLLESQILESREHYNKIPTLLRYCRDHNVHSKRSILAAVALCRIFCRLVAIGSMSKPRDAPENEIIIVQWLRSQLTSYNTILLNLLNTADLGVQNTALTLLMRLLKDGADSLNLTPEKSWRDGAFPSLILKMVCSITAIMVREEFVEKYLRPYDDVRYYTFACLRYVCSFDFDSLQMLKILKVICVLANPLNKYWITSSLY